MAAWVSSPSWLAWACGQYRTGHRLHNPEFYAKEPTTLRRYRLHPVVFITLSRCVSSVTRAMLLSAKPRPPKRADQSDAILLLTEMGLWSSGRRHSVRKRSPTE